MEQTATIIGSLISGGILQWLLNRFWLTRKEETDVAKELRAELRGEMEKLNTRVDELQTKVDAWREKYFHLLKEYTGRELEVMKLRAELDLINPKPAFYSERKPATTSKPTAECS